MPAACLPNGFEVALSWLWVACSPYSLKVRGSTFDVRRSASGRNLKHSKAGFRPSAVSLAYITRPVGGWRGPKLSPASLPCMSGESPMTLLRVSPAYLIGLAYATQGFTGVSKYGTILSRATRNGHYSRHALRRGWLLDVPAPVPFPPLRIQRAARLLQPRAYPQSLTQLVFLIAEGKPNKIANNPCAAQVSGGKVARMKDTVELVFARRVMVN